MCDCVRVCKRCKCQITSDKDFVTNGYDCACLVHDEDLDLWETELIPKKDVVMFIDDEDKECYRENGHISNEKLDLLEKMGV